MIETQAENPQGLNQRYHITRTDGTALDPSSEYFILRVDEGGRDKAHLTASRMGVLAYADSVYPDNPKMAKDIYERYNKHPVTGGMLKIEPHF